MLYSAFTSLLLGGAVVDPIAIVADPRGGARLNPYTQFARTRHLRTCEESHGLGAAPCGNATSSLCYNPVRGQSCCAADGGFCEEGTYCAPVAGYCCAADEDWAACARSAGFALPATISPSAGAPSLMARHPEEAPTVQDETGAQTAMTVSCAQSPAPRSTGTRKRKKCPSLMAEPATESKSSRIRIPDLRKEQWTLIWMGMAMGAVATFMLSC